MRRWRPASSTRWRRTTSSRTSSTSSWHRRRRTTGSASGSPSSASRSRPPKPSCRRYREQNDAISLEDRENIVVQKLTDLNAAVTKAKTERIQKEAMYNQLRAIENDPAALDTFPAILGNTFIQQQKARAGAAPAAARAAVGEVRRQAPRDRQDPSRRSRAAQLKLQAEISKVVQSVRNEYQAALAQENSLAARARPAEG